MVVLATLQLSFVVGVPSATPVAAQLPASAATGTSVGHTIVGFSLSVTVTICVHWAVFPVPSVTVHVTVVFSFGHAAYHLIVILVLMPLTFVD